MAIGSDLFVYKCVIISKAINNIRRVCMAIYSGLCAHALEVYDDFVRPPDS